MYLITLSISAVKWKSLLFGLKATRCFEVVSSSLPISIIESKNTFPLSCLPSRTAIASRMLKSSGSNSSETPLINFLHYVKHAKLP